MIGLASLNLERELYNRLRFLQFKFQTYLDYFQIVWFNLHIDKTCVCNNVDSEYKITREMNI